MSVRRSLFLYSAAHGTKGATHVTGDVSAVCAWSIEPLHCEASGGERWTCTRGPRRDKILIV